MMGETVFITKYALTKGIKKIDNAAIENGMAYNPRQQWKVYFNGEGKDWHRTFEGAVERAEQLRKARIQSLKQSLAAMETFPWTRP